MAEDARRLIDHEARVTGIVAVAVALAEIGIGEWLHDAWPQYRVWVIAGGVIAIFVLYRFVMFVIRRYETGWHAREAALKEEADRKPIPIGKLGVVDGIWLDAIYDLQTRTLVKGSVIKISSTGAGFDVEGWSYEKPALLTAPDVATVDECGHWVNTGSHWSEDSLVYSYKGDDSTRRDTGPVIYEFKHVGTALGLSGAFFGFGLQEAYLVQGFRKDENARVSPDLSREKRWLREFLSTQREQLPPAPTV